MTDADRLDRLAEKISEMSAKMDFFAETVRETKDIVGGTAKTGGLKERMAIAEDNIQRNKDAFEKINTGITALRTEMLIEIGKIQNGKKKINWESVLQAVVTSLAVGVTGIVFWQVIVWLAAHSPIK